LPRELRTDGYPLPSETAHYPQGLLSCLYQRNSHLPWDFDLVAHGNERVCAAHHLATLAPNDVVVYDRGYCSYVLLHQHHQAGIHAVCRLPARSFKVIDAFLASTETDATVTVLPSARRRAHITATWPDLDIIPLTLRLIKYEQAGTTFCLGTTLVAPSHRSIQAFMEVYHARWGVEKLYKVSKRLIEVEEFHAKTERGVKQELFAQFVLITMNRLFATQAETELNADAGSPSAPSPPGLVPPGFVPRALRRLKTNVKHGLPVLTRSLEALLLLHGQLQAEVHRAFASIVGQYQRVRPGRSYPRQSLKPESKWRARKRSATESMASG